MTQSSDLRLLHASDLHVGIDYAAPGIKHHDECVCGVLHLVDAAAVQQPDVVLVAGDLFDHPRVSAETCRWVWARLADLGCWVVVLPGNHDLMDATSLYRRHELRSGPRVVLLDDPDGTVVRICEGSLAIWGRALGAHTPSSYPLSGAPDRTAVVAADIRTRWYVVAAHGHHHGGGALSRHRSSVITTEEVEATHADYVALGHWHATTDVTAGNVPAWYPGAPVGPFATGALLRVELRTDRPADVTVLSAPPQTGCAEPLR